MRILDQYILSRDNNFNLIRLLAAFAVVISHARPIVFGDATLEFLEVETGYTLGHHAVNVFFVISGFLIVQSFVRSKDVTEYISARLLRLLPGLFMATFITAFIVAPMVTSADLLAYFGDSSTWTYVPLVSSLIVENSIELHGVFDTLAYKNEVNIPLWTLRWEFLAYLSIPILGLSGILSSGWRFGLIFTLFVAMFITVTLYSDLRTSLGAIDHALRLGYCFLLGAAFYMFRKFIPLSLLPALSLWAVTFILRETVAYQMLLITALGYSTFWLAYIPDGFIRGFNKFGDISYGVYIYGFLFGQVTILHFPHFGPNELIAVSTPIIFAAATLSYYLVEAPAIRRRKQVAQYLRELLGKEKFQDRTKLDHSR